MNRADLVDTIAQETEATKAATDLILTAFTNVVEKNIKQPQGVRLIGFGTFKTTKRKARLGRNPQTGAEIKIPARNVPVFRAGQELKKQVNKSK